MCDTEERTTTRETIFPPTLTHFAHTSDIVLDDGASPSFPEFSKTRIIFLPELYFNDMIYLHPGALYIAREEESHA